MSLFETLTNFVFIFFGPFNLTTSKRGFFGDSRFLTKETFLIILQKSFASEKSWIKVLHSSKVWRLSMEMMVSFDNKTTNGLSFSILGLWIDKSPSWLFFRQYLWTQRYKYEPEYEPHCDSEKEFSCQYDTDVGKFFAKNWHTESGALCKFAAFFAKKRSQRWTSKVKNVFSTIKVR